MTGGKAKWIGGGGTETILNSFLRKIINSWMNTTLQDVVDELIQTF
jgi:hypothetical protein